MKITAVKKISAVLLTFIMMFAFASNAFAETIQDRLEQQLGDLADQYESSDSETQESMQDQLSSLLEGAGLGDIDLGSLGDMDLGALLGGLGDNLALDSVLGLVTDAFSSGMGMIEDAIGGGLGTSDGSNTATTKPSAGGSPNVIIANTNPVSSTVAVGVPEANMPVTNAPTTYNPGSTTAENIVGPGVTTSGTTAPAVPIDDTMSSSSVAVLVGLSVATIAVIIAIVIFFVLKKK